MPPNVIHIRYGQGAADIVIVAFGQGIIFLDIELKGGILPRPVFPLHIRFHPKSQQFAGLVIGAAGYQVGVVAIVRTIGRRRGEFNKGGCRQVADFPVHRKEFPVAFRAVFAGISQVQVGQIIVDGGPGQMRRGAGAGDGYFQLLGDNGIEIVADYGGQQAVAAQSALLSGGPGPGKGDDYRQARIMPQAQVKIGDALLDKGAMRRVGILQRQLQPVIIQFGEIAVGRIALAVDGVLVQHGHSHQQRLVILTAAGDGQAGIDVGGVGKDPLAQTPGAVVGIALAGAAGVAKEPVKVVAFSRIFGGVVILPEIAVQAHGAVILNHQIGDAAGGQVALFQAGKDGILQGFYGGQLFQMGLQAGKVGRGPFRRQGMAEAGQGKAHPHRAGGISCGGLAGGGVQGVLNNLPHQADIDIFLLEKLPFHRLQVFLGRRHFAELPLGCGHCHSSAAFGGVANRGLCAHSKARRARCQRGGKGWYNIPENPRRSS